MVVHSHSSTHRNCDVAIELLVSELLGEFKIRKVDPDGLTFGNFGLGSCRAQDLRNSWIYLYVTNFDFFPFA